MGDTPLLELRGVSYGYPLPGGRRREVLRGVDLTLRRGETIALLGPNGSGKTTLLRLMAGQFRPDAGLASFDGRPLHDWSRPALARRVAVLPQQLQLPPGFRVAELVEMGRAPHATRLFGSTLADEQAVGRALHDADAAMLADRQADELSGGERQRVVVAMALAQEPELLLLDEPTVHLDLAHQVALLATIRRLRRQRSLTVVAVVHDINLAAEVGPRVVLLSEGRVAADGATHRTLTPASVASVFGVAVAEALTTDGRRHLALETVPGEAVPGEARPG
jgi:ABC-type cobalamin/Fe3+-siderophores transport system ATPase subunit